jgi:hypothetical protein
VFRRPRIARPQSQLNAATSQTMRMKTSGSMGIESTRKGGISKVVAQIHVASRSGVTFTVGTKYVLDLMTIWFPKLKENLL